MASMRSCSAVKAFASVLSRSSTPIRRSCKEQRHDELGAGVEADVALDVARIFERVVDAEDAAFAGGGAGQALVQRKGQA